MSAGFHTLGTVADYSMDLFKVGTGERADLALTGIPVIDNVTGGLFPGTLVVIGAEQGVGKSSLVMSALLSSPHKVGAIFLEDGPDMVGSRALAYVSGVNSRELRFAYKLSPGAVLRLEAAQQELAAKDNVGLEFCLGGSMEEIEERVAHLGAMGCRVIYLDYMTKVRGISDSRRSEIGHVMTRFQRACLAVEAVPVVLSQLSRLNPTEKEPEPRYKEPNVSRLKESGDIESEARVILMAWPDPDDDVNVRLAKCSFGGEGAFDKYTRESCGSLKTRKVSSEWSAA